MQDSNHLFSSTSPFSQDTSPESKAKSPSRLSESFLFPISLKALFSFTALGLVFQWALFLVLWKVSPGTPLLSLVFFAIASVLAWMFRWSGFCIALPLICFSSIEGGWAWTLGIKSVQMLSLVISILTLSEIEAVLLGLWKESEKEGNLIETLKASLSQAEFALEEANERLDQEIQEKQGVAIAIEKMERCQAELEQMEKENELLKNLSSTHEQAAHHASEQLEFVKQIIRGYVSEKFTTPDLFPELTPDLPQIEDRELRAMHEELKNQFSSKKEELVQAKKDLFLLETRYLSLQKEMEEQAFSPFSIEGMSMECFKEISKENLFLEEQNRSLEAVITDLLNVDAQPLKKKKKSKS